MRKIHLMIMLILVATSCGDTTEDPGCDIFLGSATVTGAVHDLDGTPVTETDVEFTISIEHDCHPGFPAVEGRGQTDAEGRYEVLLQSGNAVGTYCVFGRTVGSDSTSVGTVKFTSDCRRSEPIRSVELDLVFTPSN